MALSVWIFGLITLVAAIDAQISCERTYEKIGCYDVRKGKTLILKEIDGSASTNALDSMDIKTNIHSLICRCQDKARRMGFRYFAIGFYSECWIGNRIHESPSTASGTCVNGDGRTCTKDGDNDCVGFANSEYVYKIVQPVLRRRGQKLLSTMPSVTAGDEIKETPLPSTVETSLDNIVMTTKEPVSTSTPPTTPGNKGTKPLCTKDFYKIGCYSPQYYMSKMLTLRWKSADVQRYMKWKYGIEDFEEQGLEDLVCRCMNKTKEYGYNYFAIRDSDSCYIGDYVFMQPDDRISSTSCQTRTSNETCNNDDDKLCHGGAPNSLYMYKLGKPVPTSSPAPPAVAAEPNPVCKREYKKAGCWRRQTSMRLIFSDNKLNYRYYERRGGVAKKFKWEKVVTGLQGLACRCNQAAKILKGSFFAIVNNEDCFVGNAFRSFSEVVRMTSCVDGKKGECNDSDENECSGKSIESYVYATDVNWTLPQWMKLKEQARQ